MFNEVHYHRRNLPHIYVPNATYFITYRLKDSLPLEKIIELKRFVKRNIKIKNRDDLYKSQKIFFSKYDQMLNLALFGPKYLCEEKVAEIVKTSLFYFDKKEYNLICFCIMPNHVHILFSLIESSKSPTEFMKVIKGFLANEINKILNRTGALWQSESYDHIIRDEEELVRIMKYIMYNPVKANLVENWKDWSNSYLCDEFS